MFVQQVIVLGNVPVVEIGDPQVEDNVEEKGKIQDHKIETIIPYPNNSLHR